MNLKLWLKLLLKKLDIPLFWDPGQCFCKKCGGKVQDFIVEDGLWEMIQPEIKHGNVLCYNCFSELIKEKTKYTVFKLQGIE